MFGDREAGGEAAQLAIVFPCEAWKKPLTNITAMMKLSQHLATLKVISYSQWLCSCYSSIALGGGGRIIG